MCSDPPYCLRVFSSMLLPLTFGFASQLAYEEV